MRLRTSQALVRRNDEIAVIKDTAEDVFDCVLCKKLYYKAGYRLAQDYQPHD